MMQNSIWLAICETVAKPVAGNIASSFFEILLQKGFENFLKKLFGGSNVFIIFKRQSSFSNKFYNRNQADAISDVLGFGWPNWIVLYQFFIVINYICE